MSMLQDENTKNVIIGDLMIPSEKVAHVQLNNPLEHALLVLIKSGYSAVPVLDTSFKLVGTIGKTAILRSEEHTSELQSRGHLVCRLLLEKKNKRRTYPI